MIKKYEDELICDLAEVYSIYDYKSQPPLRVAIFCMGLRSDSRVKLKLTNSTFTFDEKLKAQMVDYLAMLWWSKTEDAQKNKNKPKLISKMLDGEIEKDNIESFTDGKDFETYRNELIKKFGGVNGN